MRNAETDRSTTSGDRERPSRKTTLRYFLVQIPGWLFGAVVAYALHLATDLGVWIWIGLGLWVAKDLVLFPFVWRSYIGDSPPPGAELIGAHGVVQEPLEPEGYVQIGRELWKARPRDAGAAVPRGAHIRVVGMQNEGLTLVVVREPPGP